VISEEVRPLKYLIIALLCFYPWSASSGFQQEPNQASPPGQNVPGPADQGSQGQEEEPGAAGTTEEEPVPARPTMTPLSGADVFAPSTVGGAGGGHSYILPAFQLAGYAATNPGGATARLNGNASVLGSITLQSVRKQSQFNLDYAGGEYFYSSYTNRTFHRLGVSEAVASRHWELQLSDYVSYLPESPFGFAGFGGVGSLGLGLGGYVPSGPVLDPTLGPNQTILTGRTRQLSNIAVAQAEYHPRTRSAITLTGGYGSLHFLDAGFIDSNYWTASAGYNYALTRRDTLAASYTQTSIDLHANNANIVLRGGDLEYGRKLASRLYLKLSAGPTLSRSSFPAVGVATRWFWRTSDSLNYRLSDRGTWAVSYVRYATSGSGVLLGARSDLATFTMDRELSRTLDGSADFGYARHRSLSGQPGINGGFKFDIWQGGLNLGRRLGLRTGVYVHYSLQRQNSDRPICFENRCETAFLRHVVGIGVNWHSRPLRLQ
jgi:hypothetical protein